jgi:hypothetical protein
MPWAPPSGMGRCATRRDRSTHGDPVLQRIAKGTTAMPQFGIHEPGRSQRKSEGKPARNQHPPEWAGGSVAFWPAVACILGPADWQRETERLHFLHVCVYVRKPSSATGVRRSSWRRHGIVFRKGQEGAPFRESLNRTPAGSRRRGGNYSLFGSFKFLPVKLGSCHSTLHDTVSCFIESWPPSPVH